MKRAGANLVVVLAFALGCGRGARSEEHQAAAQKGNAMASKFEVEAELVEVVLRKPPLSELHVDLIAHNPDAEPRWVIVPETIDTKPTTEGGVSTLQVLRGDDGVVIARTLGRKSFQAVRLDAGARVTVRALAINWWRPAEEPATLRLDAVIARTITVDGKPLEVELGDGATVTGAVVSHDRRLRREQSWSDVLDEVPVVIDEVSRTPLEFDLRAAKIR